jgi:hypothetical protein
MLLAHFLFLGRKEALTTKRVLMAAQNLGFPVTEQMREEFNRQRHDTRERHLYGKAALVEMIRTTPFEYTSWRVRKYLQFFLFFVFIFRLFFNCSSPSCGVYFAT